MSTDLIAPFLGSMVVILNIASALSISSQIRLTFRRKNVQGLSGIPWLMNTTNSLFNFLYGAAIQNPVFLITGFVWLVVNGAMLFLYVRYRNSVRIFNG